MSETAKKAGETVKKAAAKTRGLKTYLTSAAIVVVGIALALGKVDLDPKQVDGLLAIAGGLLAAALRAGVGKVGLPESVVTSAKELVSKAPEEQK